MNENEFLDKAKAALNQHESELDGEILTRLNRARYQALHPQEAHSEEMSAEPKGRSWLAWGGVGSIATASLIVAFVVLSPISPLDIPGAGVVNDYDITSVNVPEGLLVEDAISDEDIAILDNIEFVAWLMEQEESNAG